MKASDSRLRILIVGGVAGGASAAARARRTNEHAHIIVFEKDAHVSFANCGLPYYIGDEIPERDSLLVAKPQMLRQRFDLDVRTRSLVKRIDRQAKQVTVENLQTGEVYTEAYDKLILAPGASPIVPPLPGIRAANVFTLRNLDDADRIKQQVQTQSPRRAVVIGAGHIGLELVEQLVGKSIDVTIVELQKQVLPVFDPEMALPVQQTLEAHGVTVRLGDAIAGFVTTDDGRRATAATLSSGAELEADLFVLGIGVRPNVELARDAGLMLGASGGIATDRFMRTSDEDIYAVGDAAEYVHGVTGASVRIPLAGPANRSGRIAGQHAATGVAPPMASVMGTSIVRVFDQTAAATGLTAAQARKQNIPAEAVYVVARDHAGYYPGSSPLTLKLLYAPDSGTVLGAQAVGAAVDKRIDVIATAMAFGATVRELAGLDLAYAPQFGSAKDPVHLAAFAASNKLDGLVDFTQPDAPLVGVQVVDVRSVDEARKQPLDCAPDVHNIPVDELRQRLGELDPERDTVVVCGVGLRGHVAARMLEQHGFKHVSNLSGGYALRHRARQAGLITPCQQQAEATTHA